MLRYIISALFLSLVTGLATAQRINPDTVQAPGIRIGLDVSSFAYRYLYPNYRQYQFSLDAGYKQFYLTSEYGRASNANTRPNFSYQANGYFSRTGFDYNILKGEDMIFVGTRYAFSRFNDRFENIQVINSYYGNYQAGNLDRRVRASWAEAVAGVKIRVWGNLAMGFTGRYMLKVSLNDGGIRPHRVPGYGLANNATNFAFNYYIYYKIPVLKPANKKGSE